MSVAAARHWTQQNDVCCWLRLPGVWAPPWQSSLPSPLQERAPAQLRTEDGSGSLNWWLNRRSAVQAMGLSETAAARMMEHFVQSQRGKDLVASLR